MRSPTDRLVTACCILLALAPVRSVVAQTDRPATGRWVCFSGFETDPIYVTPVWDGTATMDDVQSGFKQVLATRYGYQGRVSCSRANMAGSTLAGIEAGLKDRNAQWEKTGKKIVQTGWTFGSPESAPAPAASPSPAPTASAEPAKWAVCRMTGVPAEMMQTQSLNGPKKNYVSSVMRVPDTVDRDSLEKAFAAFLGTKYKVTRHNAECGTGPSQTGAAAELKAWIDEAAKHRAKYGPTTETHWVITPASQ